MSVLLYLVYIASSSSLTTSTPIPSDPLYQRILPSDSSSLNPTQFGQRSTWDIVWGCLTTIFACSWVSVHPHIPPPDATRTQIALIRFELMVWTILFPEIIILLAARQYAAACDLENFYKERGWTTTHGFFIQMGGFMLYDDGVRKGVLSPRYGNRDCQASEATAKYTSAVTAVDMPDHIIDEDPKSVGV